MTLLSEIINKADSFFFYRESPRKAAVFRIAFGVILFLNYLLFLGHLTEWFSSEGILPATYVREQLSSLTFSLFYYYDSIFFISTLYTLLLVTIVFYTIGFYPRVCSFILLILTVSFHNRNPGLFHAGDMLVRFMLLMSIFIDSGKSLSFFYRGDPPESVPGWPFRIIQIQLCILYFFAGTSKMSSQMWMQGEHSFAMLNFPGRAYWDFLWLRKVPWLANLINYFTIAAEVTFPFFVWFQQTRWLAIGSVFLVHLGIMLSINVIYFSEIMFVGLVVFWGGKNIKSYQ